MNTRQNRSQNQRGTSQKNFGNNQQQQAYTPQPTQKAVFQTNTASSAASNTVQQRPAVAPVYQPSPIAQPNNAQPQKNAVNTANLAPVPQIEDLFISNNANNKDEEPQPMLDANEGDKPSSVDKSYLNRTRKKASSREIRQRQNRRLRKLLTPKNALMALYELIGNKNCDFKVNGDTKGFLAEILINNVRYEGRGISKTAAKNDASEKALRDLIIQKMVERPKKPPTNEANAENNNPEDVEMKDSELKDSDSSVEVPMLHLASFALHKLFSEWQNDGFEIPDLKNPNQQEKVVVPKVYPVKTELPANHEKLHPSMVLSMMRPNTQYVDLGSEGTTPNVVHRCGVTVDGQEYVGQDRTKKLARKAAAINACNALFGTDFKQDEIRIVEVVNKMEDEN